LTTLATTSETAKPVSRPCSTQLGLLDVDFPVDDAPELGDELDELDALPHPRPPAN